MHLFIAAVLALFAVQVGAQPFPGGSGDITARTFGRYLEMLLTTNTTHAAAGIEPQ